MRVPCAVDTAPSCRAGRPRGLCGSSHTSPLAMATPQAASQAWTSRQQGCSTLHPQCHLLSAGLHWGHSHVPSLRPGSAAQLQRGEDRAHRARRLRLHTLMLQRATWGHAGDASPKLSALRRVSLLFPRLGLHSFIKTHSQATRVQKRDAVLRMSL